MIRSQKILAVIVARKNSQGLPGKNFKDLSGKPLVNWSVLAAQNSKYIDLVTISTNCDHVKGVVKPLCSNKTKIIDRPDMLATPSSKNEGSLIHAYYWCLYKEDFDADIIVNLQPTSPLRTGNLIDKCIEHMDHVKADSLTTVSSHTPFMWRIIDGVATPNYDIKNRPMRQNIPHSDMLLHDNGNVYATRISVLLNEFCRLGGVPTVYEVDMHQGMQIDSEQDFQIFDCLAKTVYNGSLI